MENRHSERETEFMPHKPIHSWATRSREGSSSRDFKGSKPWQHLSFGLELSENEFSLSKVTQMVVLFFTAALGN